MQAKQLSSCTPYYPPPSVPLNPTIPAVSASTLILINGKSQVRVDIPDPLVIQHSPIEANNENRFSVTNANKMDELNTFTGENPIQHEREVPNSCDESISIPDPGIQSAAIIGPPSSTVYFADGEFQLKEEILNPSVDYHALVERPLYVAGEVEIAISPTTLVREVLPQQAESDSDDGDGPVEWDTDNPENSDDGSGIPRMDPSKIETMELD